MALIKTPYTVPLMGSSQSIGTQQLPGLLSAGQIKAINNGTSTSYTNDWLSLTESTHPTVKRYEVFESPEDVLALSVAWKRLRDNDKHIVGKLLDSELFNHIKQEDRNKANEIRDYYSKKVMMWKLKGDGKLTPYRDDMNNFVHGNGLVVKENMFGLIYYLPIFYEYDLNLDNVRSQVKQNQNFKKLDKENKPRALIITEDLIPISKIEKKNKRGMSTQYWFKDTSMDAGVMLSVAKGNNLEHLWEYMFDNEKVLKIKGRYIRRYIDDFEYYSVDNWELARG
jgi:hypothetical protein